MTEMSITETLVIWKEGVCLLEQGNFQNALMRFIALEKRTDSSQQLITSGRNLFNIGQSYLALGELDRAAKVRSSCQSLNQANLNCTFLPMFLSLEKRDSTFQGCRKDLSKNFIVRHPIHVFLGLFQYPLLF